MDSGLASKVLIDTNSLIYSIENRVNLKDLLQEVPEVNGILVPECVHRELQAMSGNRKYARGALELSEKFDRIPGEGYADDCIIEIAVRGHYFILSNDRALQKRAKEAGIRTLVLRGNRKVEFA